MSRRTYSTALIVGAGPGGSASLARLFTENGLKVALAARSGAKLEGLAAAIGAQVFEADASDPAQVQRLELGDRAASLGRTF